MTEETKQVDKQTEQATETEDTGSKKDWEKIAKDAQRRADDAKGKLKAYEQAQADAAKDAERLRLEAAGEYKTLLAKQAAEHEAQLADMQRALVKRDYRDQLRNVAKSADEIFLDWAVDRFSGTPEDFESTIEALKADARTSKHFQEPVAPLTPGHIPPAAAAARGANASKLSLDDRLKSTDLATKKAAISETFHKALSGEVI